MATLAVLPGCASAAPSANDAPTTGMFTMPADSSPRVPTIRPIVPPELPWLKMTTASAPASWAFSALVAKVQPPRWINAMSAGP